MCIPFSDLQVKGLFGVSSLGGDMGACRRWLTTIDGFCRRPFYPGIVATVCGMGTFQRVVWTRCSVDSWCGLGFLTSMRIWEGGGVVSFERTINEPSGINRMWDGKYMMMFFLDVLREMTLYSSINSRIDKCFSRKFSLQLHANPRHETHWLLNSNFNSLV